MKLSDYVVDFFARRGVRHNFLVSGGAVIHLVDSSAKHPDMMPICVQHEQNGAAAADMYARVTGGLGLVMTTSGPGATNIVTSVFNAFVDSVPLICLTGQVARFRLRQNPLLRQKGFQETDVVGIFGPITKYVKLVIDPHTIRYELEKAVYIAQEGRPGPVILDIPDDLQRIDVNPENMASFTPPPPSLKLPSYGAFLELLSGAKRPVLIIGAGVHSSKAEDFVRRFINQSGIPVTLTWGAADLLPADHPSNMGCLGVCGARAANFAVQASDLVIAIGTRLSQLITGGKQALFAPHAKKVMIDVDEQELLKFDSFVLDLPILSDLLVFFTHLPSFKLAFSHEWLAKIHQLKQDYPLYQADSLEAKERINPYLFIEEMSKLASENAIIIPDTGANLSWTLQAFKTKNGQRIFSAWNHTPMGYSLPASVGAALASSEEIICIIGDGGLMMCLQELGTIRRHNLPVKIFIFDNQGHGIQRQTIDTWLNSHYVAVDHDTGLYFPNYKKLAESFDLPFFELKTNSDVLTHMAAIWKQPGPFVCNVEILKEQRISPMLKFGAGIEDLDPKLPAETVSSILEALQSHV
ncbi:MAG: thiamine pyrophosphate-binding protein [Chlamydiae bacterium]|nr:thiamine pyrophosphate-binding protein [Chlamydiota bacterium]